MYMLRGILRNLCSLFTVLILYDELLCMYQWMWWMRGTRGLDVKTRLPSFYLTAFGIGKMFCRRVPSKMAEVLSLLGLNNGFKCKQDMAIDISVYFILVIFTYIYRIHVNNMSNRFWYCFLNVCCIFYYSLRHFGRKWLKKFLSYKII